jgi:hypothetical protein
MSCRPKQTKKTSYASGLYSESLTKSTKKNRTKIPRGVSGTTVMISRQRGLGRKLQTRASSNLILKNISEFGHSPSYNGAFRTRTRTPNAQQRETVIYLAAMGLYITLLAFARAQGCFGLPSPSLFPFSFFFDRGGRGVQSGSLVSRIELANQ